MMWSELKLDKSAELWKKFWLVKEFLFSLFQAKKVYFECTVWPKDFFLFLDKVIFFIQDQLVVMGGSVLHYVNVIDNVLYSAEGQSQASNSRQYNIMLVLTTHLFHPIRKKMSLNLINSSPGVRFLFFAIA